MMTSSLTALCVPCLRCVFLSIMWAVTATRTRHSPDTQPTRTRQGCVWGACRVPSSSCRVRLGVGFVPGAVEFVSVCTRYAPDAHHSNGENPHCAERGFDSRLRAYSDE